MYKEGNGTSPQTGIAVKDFEKTLPRKNSYVLTLDGWLQVKEDGYHMFFFQGARGSKLFIGNMLVMQFNDSNHTNSSNHLQIVVGYRSCYGLAGTALGNRLVVLRKRSFSYWFFWLYYTGKYYAAQNNLYDN